MKKKKKNSLKKKTKKFLKFSKKKILTQHAATVKKYVQFSSM